MSATTAAARRPADGSPTSTTRTPTRTRPATRPGVRTAHRPQRDLPRARVQVVAPTRARPKRAPFVGLIVFLLAGGLLILLLLNMVLAQDAFKVTQLQLRAAGLQDRQEALAQNVERLGAPSVLATRARALGMVVSQNPVFLRSTNGHVVGIVSPGGPSKVTRAPEPTPPDPSSGSTQPEVTAVMSGVHR